MDAHMMLHDTDASMHACRWVRPSRQKSWLQPLQPDCRSHSADYSIDTLSESTPGMLMQAHVHEHMGLNVLEQ